MAAEYVLKEGNEAVMLCERGIRTFETAYRFTLDLTAVPVLKELTPPAGRRRPQPRRRAPRPRRAAVPGRRRGRRRRHHRRGAPRARGGDLRRPAAAARRRLRRLRRQGRRRRAAVAGKAACAAAQPLDRRRPRRRAHRRLGRPGRAPPPGRARSRASTRAPRGRARAGRSTSAHRDLGDALDGADAAFVAAPVDALPRRVRDACSPQAPQSCVVTDVGSTKRRWSTPSPTRASSAAIRWRARRPRASSTRARTSSTAPPGT